MFAYLTIFYIILSIKIVHEEEIGGIILLGEPIEDAEAGPHLVPFLFAKVRRFPRGVIQQEIPGEPNEIWHEKGFPPADSKLVPPIRVTTGEDTKSTDPLDRRMTLEPTATNRFRINSVTKFLSTVVTLEEAKRQVFDVVVAFLSKEFAQRTPRTILRDLSVISGALDAEVNTLVTSWGLDSEGTQVKLVDLPRTVSEALRDVPASTLQKTATITRAEAEKQKRKLEGQGTAQAEQSLIEARGKGIKNAAELTGLTPANILAAETVQASLGKAGDRAVVLGAGGISEAMGLASTIAETLKNKTPEKGVEETK